MKKEQGSQSSQPNQEALQQQFMEFQMMHQEMQKLQQQMQKAEEQLMEVEYVQQGLQEIAVVKEDTEILVPVANGVFAKAKLQDPGNFIVNVGAEMCIPKRVEDVIVLFAHQAQQIVEVHEQMSHHLEKMMEKIKKAEAELNKVMKQKAAGQ